MKYIIFILMVFYHAPELLSQIKADEGFHVPRERLYGAYIFDIRTDLILSNTVFASFPNHAEVVFYALPTFQSEYGFWLNGSGDNFLLVVSKSSICISSDFSKDTNKIESLDVSSEINDILGRNVLYYKEVNIPYDIGSRIKKMWHKVIFNAKPSGRGFILDGTNYIYRATNSERQTVTIEATSPHPNTLASYLNDLAFDLCEYTINKDMDSLIKKIDIIEGKIGAFEKLDR